MLEGESENAIARHLDALCRAFDEEFERQELVLANCIAQGQAARAHHLEDLEARTQSLTFLMEDTLRAETGRLAAQQEVVEYFEIPVEGQTLTGLIDVVPEPWKHRLSEFQINIRKTLKKIETAVHENAAFMRGSLRVVNSSLDLVAYPEAVPAIAYTGEGRQPDSTHRSPALIDAQG